MTSLWKFLAHRTPSGSLHLFGSRVAFGRFGSRFQVLVSPRLSNGRRLSFGFGKRPCHKSAPK